MKQNIFKRSCLLLSVWLISACGFAFAQSNSSESLTITTYYPSPYGVYRNLEVRRGLAVGDITKGPLASMDNLKSGQLYINNSVVLNTLSTTPLDTNGTAGQVIYVGGSDKMIKYHDGIRWVNATLTPPPCPLNEQCRPNSWIACIAPNVCKTPSAGNFAGVATYYLNCPSGPSCTFFGSCWLNAGSGPDSCPSGQHSVYTITGTCTPGLFYTCTCSLICVYD